MEINMSFKIVVDSCCELPEEYLQDSRFEIVPLGLEVGDYQIQDDENFDQAEFLKKVAECPKCPKSACPSPERFREAYHTEAEHVYVITLSSHLSGSYNSAVLGMNLYREKYGKKQIHIIDSESASCGETQIVKKLVELEEQRLSFEEIVKQIEEFRSNVHTYFVLDNLEDVVIELKQAYNTVNIYSDILTGTMDAFASIISNNVNAIMKRMTSLSITLMIPTLIASFYGMNVDIHLEGFPHAFVFIVLLSAILSAVTFIWFRKIKWF